MCKVLEYRYTECRKPRNAGPDYDEFAPGNLCDGRRQRVLKAPCLIQVCARHEGGVARYHIEGGEVANLKCNPTVEIVYIRSKCRHCGADNAGRYDVHADKNNRIMRKPKLLIRTGADTSFRPMDDYTVHVPSIPWKDPSFRMPNWNPTSPRQNALDDQELVSPFTVKECQKPTGIINRWDGPEDWVDADLRPTDLLQNHYDEIGDHPSCKVDRFFYHHRTLEFHQYRHPVVPQAEPQADSRLPQDGTSQPVDSGGASQPMDSRSEEAQREPRADETQEASQVIGPATGGGAEPPPSPPRQPSGSSDIQGRRENRLSNSSSESEESSTSSPRDRSDSPGRAATELHEATQQAPAQQPAPQEMAQAGGPQAEAETRNVQRYRPFMGNGDGLEFIHDVWAETNVNGRLLVLGRVQHSTEFAWRWVDDRTAPQFSLAQWETLLGYSIIYHHGEVAELRETIREDRLEEFRRIAARDELRAMFDCAAYPALPDDELDQLLERSNWNAQIVYDAWQDCLKPIPSVEVDDAPSNQDAYAEQTVAHGDSGSGADGRTSLQAQRTPIRSLEHSASPSATRTTTVDPDLQVLLERNTGMPAHIQELMDRELRQRDEEAERQRLQRERRGDPQSVDEEDLVEIGGTENEGQTKANGGGRTERLDKREAERVRRKQSLEDRQRQEEVEESERARQESIRDYVRQQREHEFLESRKAAERERLERDRAVRRLAGKYDDQENGVAASAGDLSADEGQQTGEVTGEEPAQEEEQQPDGVAGVEPPQEEEQQPDNVVDEEPPREEEEEEQQPAPRVKRRKGNDGRAVPPPPVQIRTRPHTRSMGPPTESAHHMRLRPRPRPTASSSAAALRGSGNAPAPSRRGRGRGRAGRSGAGTGTTRSRASGRKTSTRTTTTTKTKDKPRSKNGVLKKAKTAKKSTTTTRRT